MSLVAQSASVSAATRAAAHGAVEHPRQRRPEALRPDTAADRTAPNVRHALVDAIDGAVQTLAPAANGDAASADAAGSAGGPASRQAFHAFVHALFTELRPTDAEGRHGRGFAWGRTSASDLAGRLDALVDRLQGAADADAARASDAAATLADDVVVEAGDGAAADSPLLSAFRRLVAERAGGADGTGASDASASLAAVLGRLAEAIAGDRGADGAAASGSLLDVTV